MSTIDPQAYRETLGHYPTGVVLVTGIADDGAPVGMIVGSFTSVSLDPPLVAYLPMRTSYAFQRLRTGTSFCVNVLGADQEDLCRRFASRIEDKFTGVGWTPAPSGAPILDGVVAWIDCVEHDVVDGGDHYIAIGQITDLRVVDNKAPLLFFQGGYGRFSPLSLVAPAGRDLVAGVQLGELARSEMEALVQDLDLEVAAFVTVGNDIALVASANTERTAGPMLGMRLPFRPPLGELFVAWEDQDAINAWLGRAGKVDDSTKEVFVDRLTAARKRGWSSSLANRENDRRLYSLLREYSDAALTPAREREIMAGIAAQTAYYEPIDLVPQAHHDLYAVVAPVFGGDGRVQIVLRLSGMPLSATTEQVLGWVDRLREGADRVSALLKARPVAAAR